MPVHDLGLGLRLMIDTQLNIVDIQAVSDGVRYPGLCDSIDTTCDKADADQNHKPFQLDRYHALRCDRPAVAKYYPRWAVRPRSASESV